MSPGFFAAWDLYVEGVAAWSEPHFQWAGSPSYLKKLVEFCESHAAAVSEECDVLVRTFSRKFFEPGGPHEIVASFSMHWTLWRHQTAEFSKDWETPEAGSVFLAADYAEPL